MTEQNNQNELTEFTALMLKRAEKELTLELALATSIVVELIPRLQRAKLIDEVGYAVLRGAVFDIQQVSDRIVNKLLAEQATTIPPMTGDTPK